jgi:hypothetical protein
MILGGLIGTFQPVDTYGIRMIYLIMKPINNRRLITLPNEFIPHTRNCMIYGHRYIIKT